MTVKDLVLKFKPFAHAVKQDDGSWDIYSALTSPNGIVHDLSREEVIGFSLHSEHEAWLSAAKEVIPEETLAYHLIFWREIPEKIPKKNKRIDQ